MALKCIQHTMKENLLLLNNLLELSKTRFLSTWQPFQRMFMSHDMPDDIVNKYNNRVHRMIKMKPLTLHLILMLNTLKILTKKILNWKLVIVSEYQNTKTFLLKDILKIGQKKFLLLVKLKIQFHGHMLLMISMVKKLLEHFMKKNCKRLIKNNLE